MNYSDRILPLSIKAGPNDRPEGPDVPIRRNTVTRYIGRLFSEQFLSVSMQSDDEWNVNTVTF